MLERFVALFDTHVGWSRKDVRGKQVVVPIHNERAIKIAVDFTRDFKPHHIIYGGDQIDCGPVSHHNQGKPGLLEGLSLKAEFDAFRELVLKPMERAAMRSARKVWHRGNHEKWIGDLINSNPALAGLVSAERYLNIHKRYSIYDYGEVSRLGKLYFMHGDNVQGGVNVARNAALRYLRNIRFGHFHTHQTFTLDNPIDSADIKTAKAVPCLCNRGPGYGNNAPNRWMNGFLYGWVDSETGNYTDCVVEIVQDRTIVHGKEYGG